MRVIVEVVRTVFMDELTIQFQSIVVDLNFLLLIL